MIKIGIADNQYYFKRGVMAALSMHSQLKVVWSVNNLFDLNEVLSSNEPNILLLGSDLKDLDLFFFLSRVSIDHPLLKIIVFISFSDIAQARELLDTGISGVISREHDQDEICEAVRSVVDSGMYFNELLNRALLTRLRRRLDAIEVNAPRFSTNEIRVLELLAKGHSSEEIASRIFLSTKSVENIRYQLKIKTGVASSTALVVYALRQRLIRWG